MVKWRIFQCIFTQNLKHNQHFKAMASKFRSFSTTKTRKIRISAVTRPLSTPKKTKIPTLTKIQRVHLSKILKICKVLQFQCHKISEIWIFRTRISLEKALKPKILTKWSLNMMLKVKVLAKTIRNFRRIWMIFHNKIYLRFKTKKDQKMSQNTTFYNWKISKTTLKQLLS